MPEPPVRSTKPRSGVGLDELLGSCNHGPACLTERLPADAAGSDGLHDHQTHGFTERPTTRGVAERAEQPIERMRPKHTPNQCCLCCRLTPELSRPAREPIWSSVATKRVRLGRTVRQRVVVSLQRNNQGRCPMQRPEAGEASLCSAYATTYA
jgi:hypothetical protein